MLIFIIPCSMTKMDPNLKINIKIFSYNTIKVIKHCFGGRILFVFFSIFAASWNATPRKSNGSVYSEFCVLHSYPVRETNSNYIVNSRHFLFNWVL
jgi:hypothetical protein